MEPSIFISPSLLFPPISFFSQALNTKEITIDVHENYQKRSFRNKYLILSSNGILPLSVPLSKGKNQQQKIKDVTISYAENWIKIHLDALKSAYGKSPYFEHYYPTYIQLLNKKFATLNELNNAALRLILSQLKSDIFIKEIKFSAFPRLYAALIL